MSRSAANYCTVRTARQVVGSIVFCSIIYNSLRFPQFNLRTCVHNSSQEEIIEICPTSLFFTINTVYNVYMYMVLMTVLPFLFLSILNALIVVRQSSAAKKEQKALKRLEEEKRTDGESSERAVSPASPASPASAPQDSGGDDTITMIMVVVLFLACNTLVGSFICCH